MFYYIKNKISWRAKRPPNQQQMWEKYLHHTCKRFLPDNKYVKSAYKSIRKDQLKKDAKNMNGPSQKRPERNKNGFKICEKMFDLIGWDIHNKATMGFLSFGLLKS